VLSDEVDDHVNRKEHLVDEEPGLIGISLAVRKGVDEGYVVHILVG